MKVLHIIDSFGLGGAQTVVKGIFEFQPENKDIFLYVLRKRNIAMEIKHPNVKIFNSTKKYSLKPLFELKNLIKNENIDILHCHLFRSNIFGVILKIVWFPKIRLVIHEHGEIFQNHFFYNFFLRLSGKRIDKIVAVSWATKEELVKRMHIPENRVYVLPNFVDLDKFNKKNIVWDVRKEREKLGIKKDEFVIGFVGRLAKVKGGEYLIRALAQLDFSYKAMFVGDGLERNSLEKLTKYLNINNKIIFRGYSDNVVFLYSLFDVLVVPSIFESFGMSVLEAQAMGIPVIASDIVGVDELIGKDRNGILFKVKKHVDLAEKIILLKNDTKLKESLAKNAMADIKKYSLSSYINNLKSVYE